MVMPYKYEHAIKAVRDSCNKPIVVVTEDGLDQKGNHLYYIHFNLGIPVISDEDAKRKAAELNARYIKRSVYRQPQSVLLILRLQEHFPNATIPKEPPFSWREE
jgi:hypothetical protein